MLLIKNKLSTEFQFKLCVKAFHIVLTKPSVFNTLLKDFPDMK